MGREALIFHQNSAGLRYAPPPLPPPKKKYLSLPSTQKRDGPREGYLEHTDCDLSVGTYHTPPSPPLPLLFFFLVCPLSLSLFRLVFI